MVRGGIEPFALVVQLFEGLDAFWEDDGPVFALCLSPSLDFGEGHVEPDDSMLRFQCGHNILVVARGSTDRQHNVSQWLAQRFFLRFAKGGLSESSEVFGLAHAMGSLEQVAGIEERPVQLSGQNGTQSGFASVAHSLKHDHFFVQVRKKSMLTKRDILRLEGGQKNLALRREYNRQVRETRGLTAGGWMNYFRRDNELTVFTNLLNVLDRIEGDFNTGMINQDDAEALVEWSEKALQLLLLKTLFEIETNTGERRDEDYESTYDELNRTLDDQAESWASWAFRKGKQVVGYGAAGAAAYAILNFLKSSDPVVNPTSEEIKSNPFLSRQYNEQPYQYAYDHNDMIPGLFGGAMPEAHRYAKFYLLKQLEDAGYNVESLRRYIDDQEDVVEGIVEWNNRPRKKKAPEEIEEEEEEEEEEVEEEEDEEEDDEEEEVEEEQDEEEDDEEEEEEEEEEQKPLALQNLAPCPEGKIRNPDSNRCVTIGGKVYQRVIQKYPSLANTEFVMQPAKKKPAQKPAKKIPAQKPDKFASGELKKFMVETNQLGKEGKEGVTYKVDMDGQTYALKTFRASKSGEKIEREAEFQQMAAVVGVSPNVEAVQSGKTPKYILMEMMKERLVDYMKRKKLSTLTKKHQEQLIDCMKRLDEVDVLHNDGNMLNIMLDDGENIQMIDFGMAKFIPKKYKNKRSANGSFTLSMIVRSMRHHRIDAGEIVKKFVENSKQNK